jgi:hypothetical protein
MPVGACAAADDGAAGGLDVRRVEGRPSVALVVRDGDPASAVGAVVLTSAGSYASSALAAVVEARLQKAGFAQVTTRADRDAFRVRVLLGPDQRPSDLVAALEKALAEPVAPGAPELALAARRVATLKRHPLEAPIAVSAAKCSGEIGALATEPVLDPVTSEGAAQLEAVRAAAFGASRVALGAAGSASFTASVADAVRASEPWPKSIPPEPAWPTNDEAGAYPAAGLIGGARLTLAFSTRRAEAAVSAAAAVGASDGALAARLRSLAVPFRIVEASGSARPTGGCASVTLETTRQLPSSGIEEPAALAARITRQEVERAKPADTSPRDRTLGSDASRAIRAASDPRDAAELAAVWSISTPASASDNETVVTSLALPAPNLDPRDATADVASRAATSTARFTAALAQLEKVVVGTVLEHRERVEHGQGELWVLVASPCGTAVEGATDSGFSALGAMAALAARGRDTHGVVLEPWIAADGVGIIAHAAKAPGESTSLLTARVAEEAGRVLVASPFAQTAFFAARGALLDRLGDGVSADGRALDAFAGAVVPGHPSWIAPLGSWDDLAKSAAEAASLRWSAITAGPLRAAVLANDDADQAETIERTLDRWLVRTTDQPRACPPVESPLAPHPSILEINISPPPPPSVATAQALVGFAVAPQGSPESRWAELTMAGLNGAEGWLAKALASPSLGATAQARLLGGPRGAALVVDVRAPEPQLDAAVAQIRGLFQRLSQGAIAQADLERSATLRDKWDAEAALDPRRRLVDLWRDARPSPKPPATLEAWRAWAAGALKDDKLIVVLARSKRG